jgi:hypothetical protein
MHDARCDERSDNIIMLIPELSRRLWPTATAVTSVGVFHTCYSYDHARRLRLEQLSCLGLSGPPQSGFRRETAVA